MEEGEGKMTVFKDEDIRRVWRDDEWYFSVVDVVGVLSGSVDAGAYWRKLKQRLIEEGNETVTDCHGLKMVALDGKLRLTDSLDVKGILRIVQSIPSKKAEPFKLWLAEVGSERLDEQVDPELSINRAMKSYLRLGKSEAWINQRLKSIEIRKDLVSNDMTLVGLRMNGKSGVLRRVLSLGF